MKENKPAKSSKGLVEESAAMADASAALVRTETNAAIADDSAALVRGKFSLGLAETIGEFGFEVSFGLFPGN